MAARTEHDLQTSIPPTKTSGQHQQQCIEAALLSRTRFETFWAAFAFYEGGKTDELMMALLHAL
jgi:hypothetical protein